MELSAAQWGALERYLNLVRKANKKTNLTSAQSMEELALRHAADGLIAVPLLKRLLAGRKPRCADVQRGYGMVGLAGKAQPMIMDVGSGAGFIGISIKIAWPEARVHILEPNYKKFEFLNMAAIELGLKDTKLFWERAESASRRISAGEGGDAVLERALAPLEEALRLCLPLCRPEGGFVLAYQSEYRETPTLRRVLAQYNVSLHATEHYRLPEQSRDRRLLIYRRGQETQRPHSSLGPLASRT